MKNSAETRTGFSLFSINEHRLSFGLLAMMLLAGGGYGIWLAIVTFLPSITAPESPVSRNQIGDAHFEKSEWQQAIENYQEILTDDPDNSYVMLKIAAATDNRLTELWDDEETVEDETGTETVAPEALKKETALFQLTIEQWSRLLDSARYRNRAIERLACLHSLRSKVRDDSDEADKAITWLRKLIGMGTTTSRGLYGTRALRPLREHPQFEELLIEEAKIFNPQAQRGIRGQLGRPPPGF